MTAFYAWLSNFLTTLVKTPLTHLIAYWAGKRAGKKDQQVEQQAQDLDAIARAEAARRAVKSDVDSVRNDPFNRDNYDKG